MAQSVPEIDFYKAGLLSWMEDPEEEHIVVGAETVDGPRVPCLEPIFYRHGARVMTVPIAHLDQWIHTEEYFNLVPGRQLIDDFSDQNQLSWTECFPDPTTFEFSYLDGALQITAPSPNSWGARAVRFPGSFSEPEPLLHADFAMSIDILDWDEDAAEMSLGLIARATMPANCSELLQSSNYIGLLVFRSESSSTIQIYGNPPNEALTEDTSIELDPAHSYRLVFSGAGDQLTLRLLDLEDLSDVVEPLELTNTTPNNPNLSEGGPGLWFLTGNNAYDVTVGNYVVSGTKPSP